MRREADVQAGLVSVMMPVHNAEAYVGQAIESLLTQTYGRWELIAVDDGSTDRSRQVIGGYVDRRIRLVTQDSRGEAAARNRALEEMNGEFVAFLDADDLFLDDHLRSCVDYLSRNPTRSAVYTDGWTIDPAGRRLDLLSRRRRGPFEGDLFEPLVRASDVFGPPICLVLRRRPILDRGLAFDTRIVIGPDWDFTTHYAEAAEFGYLAQPSCLYRLHPQSISASTGDERRQASLAQCRTNAIHRRRFGECSVETRAYAFYDLLVHHLRGDERAQEAAVAWPTFQGLPAAERSRLYRLMAAERLRRGGDGGRTVEWLRRAVELGPREPRNRLLLIASRVSPRFGQWLLRLRRGPARPPIVSRG